MEEMSLNLSMWKQQGPTLVASSFSNYAITKILVGCLSDNASTRGEFIQWIFLFVGSV
jgi:hypothetical protein